MKTPEDRISQESKLSPQETIHYLENLISATLIATDREASDEEKANARNAREQTSHMLWGKPWEEAKLDLKNKE